MQAFLISRLENIGKAEQKNNCSKGDSGKLGELSTGLKNELA